VSEATPGPDDGSDVDAEAAEAGSPPDLVDHRRVRWSLLTGGVLMVGAAVWAFATGWVGLTGSHPVGWITTLVTALVGLGFSAGAFRAGQDRRVPAWRRWTARIAATLTTVVLIGVVVYTRPLSADRVALDALADGADVVVSDGATSLTMSPADPARTGLVFYPGAKVDPRAYARVLRPLAQAGYQVVVAKQPYNLAILAIGAADRWIGVPDDDVDRWVIGGHSLGGAMAAAYASDQRPELAGLLLYAAYPTDDLSDRALAVVSVSGTRDGLATPADIAESVAELPPTTTFVAIEGAIHAYFGDYGSQRGDGEPTVRRETAQGDIVAATLDLLQRVDAGR
jgi:pimeloyl-ACP methyl ester carboxylesterase